MNPEAGGFPVADAPTGGLSLIERDRRWRVTRELMVELGLDLLLVTGFRGREQYEHYLSDDYLEGAVIFPLDGDPVALGWTDTRQYRAEMSFSRGSLRWIDDYRVGLAGASVAGLVRELSPRGEIGIVGLDTFTAGEVSGYIPARFWIDLIADLPDRRITDVSWEFSAMMLPKSEEELALLRWAAAAGEAAGQAMLGVVAAGVPETEIYAEILSTIHRRGCSVRYPTLILHSGSPSLAWGPPRWTTTAEAPRALTDPDHVQAEIFSTFGDLEAQVQMSVVLGEPDPSISRCAQVAHDSYAAGLSVLQAGIAFDELVRAMEAPVAESGCWAMTPLVHTVNPQTFIGMTFVNREEVPKLPSLPGPTMSGPPPMAGIGLELKPGTTLVFEPNACLGRTRVNVGGTVIVTETGYEELNPLSASMSRV